MLKGLKITLFALLAVFSVGFLADLQIAEASVTSEITVNVEPEPEPDPFQLIVNIDGNGSGTVSSDPSGISCPESCIASYPPETSVTLTATADSGSIFSGWSGDCSGTGTCSVTMNSAKNVTATFSLTTPSATITASNCTIPAGQGSCNSTVNWSILNATIPNVKQGPTQFSTNVSGNNVSQTIPYGTITFSANDGNTLLESDDATASCSTGTVWSGSVCEGPKTLTVSKNGTGTVTSSPTGINCGTDCSQSYSYNTEVDLTAEAGENYIFSSWSGCDSSSGTSCSVTMSSVKNVTANFTAEGELDGTIYASLCYVPANQSSCSANISWNVVNYSDGSTSEVTTPDHIQVGDEHSGSTTYSLSLSEGIRYFFLYNSGKTDVYLASDLSWASCATGTTKVNGVCRQNYTVTFNSNGGTGTMSPQTFTASVGQNLSTNTFTKIGYNFAGWNTSSNGTGTSYTDGKLITVSSNMILYAMWNETPVVPDTYTVTFNANGGTGTMSPQTFTASVGQNLTTNTFTKIGYNFAGWNTSPGGTGTSYSDRQFITVNSNMTLYAMWNKMSGTITANPNPCQIAEGQSTCNTTLTWSVQNPISTTAVTTPVNQTIFTGHSGSGTYSVEHGGRTFYLYNSGELLGQITASANCISGTEWNGSICQAIPEMAGNLSVSPTSCEIPYDQESCSVSVSWNVYNPESSNTAVTISPNGEVFATGHSGSKDYPFTSSNSVTFYLYNNGKLLAQAIASATKEPAPPMEGTIIANPNPCQIAEGQSTCDTTIAWSVQNPISTTAVTTPVNQTIFTGHSGSETYPVEHGGRTFYLYNNSIELGQIRVSADCEGGTSWLGSSCEGPKELIVSRNGAGTVTSDVYGISCGSDCSGVYAHGSSVTLTATVTEADNSMFSSWSGCDEVNGNTCTVLMDEDKNVTANFMEAWVDAQSSFVEGSSIYNTIPNTIITIPYTTSSSLSPSECRLLDYEKLPLAEYYETDNPITLTSPSSSGSYKYYIQCRNQNNYNITAVSEEIIVNAVAVSVSLLKISDTALPSSDYNFAFVPYSSPNVEYLNHVSCRLLDSDKNKLKPQDDTWISVNLNEPNGIYHKLPGGYLGSFGYYIRCRNDVVTIAEADSDKMTITTYCPEGKKLYEGICVASGISASDCVIETGESSCDAAINWEIPSLDGVWAITANIPVPNTTVVDIFNNIGQVYHTLPRVSDFPFFLYNDGVEVDSSRAYARCRPGTVWTFSPDGTTGTCEIMQNSIDVTICSIPLGENSCQTEASWWLDNIPPGKDINDFIFKYPAYPENKLVHGEGLVGEDRKQTLYDVTLFHGDNDFKIFDGADLIGEKNILGACVDDTKWDTESGTCVIKEPEINYFKAEPESVFRGQPTTLSWGFEEDRVDYCLLEKKLIIDETQELLKTIGKEEYQSSLKDSPSGTTVYYMTCYKEGSEPTDTKEAIVSVIDMVIEEK